jgi:hypothetical protein
MSRVFFRRVKQGVLQFALIKPVTAVLAIVLDRHDLYNEGEYSFKTGYLWITLINNFSITLSLYCLVLFYMATEERLAPYEPFYKFLTVKAILFFSFWQGCLFQIFYAMEIVNHEQGSLFLNLIICAEIVAAAVA